MSATDLITARCPGCGPQPLLPAALRVAVEPGHTEGLSSFTCPDCGREVVRAMHSTGVALARAAGARVLAGGSVPLELVEAHTGSALSMDEVDRFVVELAAEEFPQSLLGQVRPGS